MRLAVTTAAAMLAACGNDTGVVIIVDSPLYTDTSQARVTQFELIVGLGDPHAATLDVAPDGPSLARLHIDTASAWYMEPEDRDRRVPLSLDEASARFVYTPGSTDFGPIVAIGYGEHGAVLATGVLFDVHIPSSHVVEEHHLQLALRPAPTAVDTFGGCAYLPETETLLTVQGDEDCDGLADDAPVECLPDVALGTDVPLDTLDCVRPIAATDSCTLGGPACIDGTGDTSACTASAYCTAPSLCTLCAQGPGSGGALDCAAHAPAVLPTLRLECTLHTREGQFCDTEVTAPAPLTDLHCAKIHVRGDANGQETWDESLRMPGSDPNHSAKLDFSIADDCAVTVKLPNGTVDVAPLVAGLLAADLRNGRGIATPLLITTVADPMCMPSHCDFSDVPGDRDAIGACLAIDRAGIRVDD